MAKAVKKELADPYASVNDVAGVQVRTILGFRDVAASWATQLPELERNPPSTPSGRLYQRMLASVHDLIETGPAVLDKLEKAFSKRKPIRFDDRAAAYFHMVFPQLPPIQPTTQAPMILPGSLIFALHRAEELLEVPQFVMKPSADWQPENRIFEKERIYRNRLQINADFRAAIKTLRRNHPQRIADLKTPVIIDPDDLEPHADEFMSDVTVLCGDFSLLGLTRELRPLPGRFAIHMEQTGLQVSVPGYMEFDWRRDFPAAVARMLHARGHFMTTIRPFRLHEQERASGWGCSDKDLLAAYDRFKPQLATGMTKAQLYDQIADQINITQAEGPDDRRRVVCRRLNPLLAKRQRS